MKYTITSTIDSYIVEGNTMQKSRPVIHAESDGELRSIPSDSDVIIADDEKELDDNAFHHRSQAQASKKGMFHRVLIDHKGVKQVTNINVKIEQPKEDDAVSGCFKSLFKCLR